MAGLCDLRSLFQKNWVYDAIFLYASGNAVRCALAKGSRYTLFGSHIYFELPSLQPLLKSEVMFSVSCLPRSVSRVLQGTVVGCFLEIRLQGQTGLAALSKNVGWHPVKPAEVTELSCTDSLPERNPKVI